MHLQTHGTLDNHFLPWVVAIFVNALTFLTTRQHMVPISIIPNELQFKLAVLLSASFNAMHAAFNDKSPDAAPLSAIDQRAHAS
jgi:hypothetical protein